MLVSGTAVFVLGFRTVGGEKVRFPHRSMIDCWIAQMYIRASETAENHSVRRDYAANARVG